MIFIIGYHLAHSWVAYMISMSYNSLMMASLNEKYRNFTYSDRISAAELHIWFYFARELFLAPFLLTIACIKDQMKLMSSLKSKATQIYLKIQQIESMDDNEINTSNNNFDGTTMNRFGRELDERAMKLYI